MYDRKKLDELHHNKGQWEQQTLKPTLNHFPERREAFITTSSEPIQRIYTPLDVEDLEFEHDLGFPGEYPFTRGIHATMHRGRLWTMRMFAGFGTAEETNLRFKFLLDQGQTGLSVAFDLPTLMGYDTDAPESLGEFGKCGVAVSSLKDMEILLDGIPLDQVSTSMTINSPAAIIWAMYIATAEKQGVRPEQLRGTIQNDILKEYILDAPGNRYYRIWHADPAAVEHHLDFRLPHSGGWLHRRPGIGFHPGRWVRVCALGR